MAKLKQTKYRDISKTIHAGMEKYPSDPKVSISSFKSLKKGNSCNLLELGLGSHTGTHIDASCHIFEGARSVDKIKVRDLICDVAVTTFKAFLKNAFFAKGSKKVKGILFKSERKKTGLRIDEAERLVAKGIRLVGTEGMSIDDSVDKYHPVHRLLLKGEVVIIENLNLKKVKPGRYRLICLPLKIENGDGAPARAILAYD